MDDRLILPVPLPVPPRCTTNGQVSLNENDWDTHVSFTVMSMAASSDGKYLLAATDKSR